MRNWLTSNWFAVVLLAIVTAALLLRLVGVGSLPAILNRDEAALGYNALLLSQSGRDEWEKTWPVVFESFGDYKLPGYIYTLVAVFAVFGTSDAVVRLPAVMAGTVLVMTISWWARQFVQRRQYWLLMGAAIAASPILIFFSRMAFEAMLALWLFTTAWWCLFIAKKPWCWLLGMIGIWLSCLTYNTPLILFAPLLILTIWWQIPHFHIQKWGVVVVTVVGWLLIMALLLPLTQQKRGITLVSDPTVQAEYVAFRQRWSGITQKLIGNRYAYLASLSLSRSTASFSPQFMVQEGGAHPWHQVPGTGHVVWSTYVLGWIGLVLATTRQLKRWWGDFRQHTYPHLVASGWVVGALFISLLPAVITVDAPHATRSLLFFVIWLLLAVMGVEKIVVEVQKHWHTGVITLAVVVVVLSIDHLGYLYRYVMHFPRQQAVIKAGFSQALSTSYTANPDRTVIVQDLEGYHYILAAWYLKIPAVDFFATVQRRPKNTIGFSYGSQVGRVQFSSQPVAELSKQPVIYWDEQQLRWLIKE